MKSVVSIVDYGASNLHNVARAVEATGHAAEIVNDPGSVSRAGRLIVPGVGAFGDSMKSLRGAGFVEPILEFIETGRPMMGICLGMQMLFEGSDEYPTEQGLGVLPGRCSQIPTTTDGAGKRKIPHIGWATLEPLRSGQWAGTPLRETTPSDYVYFVHSYAVPLAAAPYELAATNHAGFCFSSFVMKDNVFGSQFHPEKSGPVGLRIIEAFVTN